MPSSCPICIATDVYVRRFDIPRFSNLDFSQSRSSGDIGFCHNCGLLINLLDEQHTHKFENMYRGEQYSQSHQTGQTYNVPGFTNPVTRADLQAKLIQKNLPFVPQNILDIGCFDFSLLDAIASIYPNAVLHAHDVNPHTKQDTVNIIHFDSFLDSITGPFDLIILSNSLPLEKNLGWMFDQLDRLLSPEGQLLIQVQDCAANPYYLFLDDQTYYFDESNLTDILSIKGYAFDEIGKSYFPRLVTGLARRNETQPMKRQGNNTLEDLYVYFTEVKNTLQSSNHEVNILGTTLNAAIVHGMMDGMIKQFVDENQNPEFPGRVNFQFKGLPITHPSDLSDSDTILLPYGPAGEAIKERMDSLYRGIFTCI